MTVKKYHAPAPDPQESLLGYLHRVAGANHYPDITDFLTGLGCRYGRPLVERIGWIERVLDLPEDSLATLAPSTRPPEPALDWLFERHHSDPICPQCLQEAQIRRKAWRHALVVACPQHETVLIDECPRCRERLSPASGCTTSCGCGHPLEGVKAEQATPVEVALASFIGGALETSDLSLPWRSPAPGDFGRFVFMLASHQHRSRTEKKRKAPMPRSVRKAREFLAPLEEIFKDWPRSFDAHIRVRLDKGDPDAMTAPARLGRWYHDLLGFKDDFYTPFRERLSAVVSEHFDGPYPGLTADDGEGHYLTAAEAARRLHVRAERLVAAVREEKIEGRIWRSGLGHSHTVIPITAIKAIENSRTRYVSKIGARSFLGTTRTQFDLLIEAGVIPICAEGDRPPLTDGSIDMSELKKRLFRIPISTNGVGDGELVMFRDLTLRRTTERRALLDLFRAIFQGRVSAVSGGGATPLADYKFLWGDVDAALDGGPGQIWWTANDIAVACGWKPEVVTHWCASGLLDARRKPHSGHDKYLVSPKKLSDFQKRFVTTAELAKEMEMSPRKLRERLIASGIEIYGQRVTGSTSRGGVVLIKDLATIALEIVEQN